MRDAISGLRPVISIDINPAMHPSLYSHTASFGATESLTSPLPTSISLLSGLESRIESASVTA